MEIGVIVSARESETARERDDLNCWASFTYINYHAKVYNEMYGSCLRIKEHLNKSNNSENTSVFIMEGHMNSQHKAVWKGQEVMSDKSLLDWAGAWLPLCGTPRCVCIHGAGVSVPDCYSLTALELFLKCWWKISLWVSSTKRFQHFFLDFLTVLNYLFVCGDITAIPALQKMSFSEGLFNAERWQEAVAVHWNQAFPMVHVL